MLKVLFGALLFWGLPNVVTIAGELAPVQLRCEYQADPLAIDAEKTAAELGVEVEREGPAAECLPGVSCLHESTPETG